MNLKDEFKIIIEFAKDCPESLFDQKKPLLSFPKHDKKKFKYMDAEHLRKLEKKFLDGRFKKLKPPQTFADFAVYSFLKKEKNYNRQEIRKVKVQNKILSEILSKKESEFTKEDLEEIITIYKEWNKENKVNYYQSLLNKNWL